MTIDEQVVWKWELPIGESSLSLPPAARVIHVGCQGDNRVCVWTLQPTINLEVQLRRFTVIGTGQTFNLPGWMHIGTAMTTQGVFVWHVFEEVRDA